MESSIHTAKNPASCNLYASGRFNDEFDADPAVFGSYDFYALFAKGAFSAPGVYLPLEGRGAQDVTLAVSGTATAATPEPSSIALWGLASSVQLA